MNDWRFPLPVSGQVYWIAELLEKSRPDCRQLWLHGKSLRVDKLDQTLPHGGPSLRLEELPLKPSLFRAFAFCPLRATSIEVFRK